METSGTRPRGSPGTGRRACSCGARPAAASRRSGSRATPPTRPPVAISRPTVFVLGPVRRRRGATTSPRNITAIPVGQLPGISSSSAETSRMAAPGVALGDDLAVDELDAADVQAAGRLVEDQQADSRRETRGRRRPSAGCRPTASPADRRGRRADVVLLDPLLRASRDRGVVAQDPASVRRLVVAGQDEVVGDREGEHEAEPVAVAGDEREARGVDHPGPRPVMSRPVERDAAGGRLAQPHQRLDQLVLAVARRRRRCRGSRPPGPRSRCRGRPPARGRP